MDSINQICSEVRQLTDRVVKRNLTDGILFSGGLDTSIIAFEASKYAKLESFTVAFENSPALDLKYAKLMADLLKMNHTVHVFGEEEMHSAIQDVIKILKVFDPMDVRNSVAAYVGLKAAKENGIKEMMTGDGLDELLGGYSWLFGLNEQELKDYLSNMWQVMQFTSIPMAKSLGLVSKPPFLDAEFKSYTYNVDTNLMIRPERGKMWGKWIMRKAYEGLLPDEIVWRIKTPLEFGSGTTIFPKVFGEKISDKYFQQKSKKYQETDQVTIRDKEHLFYYEIFRSTFGVPSEAFKDVEGKQCPYCKSTGGNVKSKFCKVCGAYPI
ncbi:asparagine synthase-related protein [Candidatus Bathyarchaeota archaeon]|nr:asparagine synthase-related protein [Candidatus Bathyarchaeota archaeon]